MVIRRGYSTLPLLFNPTQCTLYYELNASDKDGSNENKLEYCLKQISILTRLQIEMFITYYNI